MLSIPLPLAVSAMLAFLLARLAADGRDWTRSKTLFAALLGVCAVHGALIALFWGYGVAAARPAIPILASLLPLLTWLAFRSLAGMARLGPVGLALRLLPVAAIPALMAVWPPLIDLLVMAQFTGYGVALLLGARAGPDGLRAALLDRAVPAHRAMWWAGLLLLANAVADLAILADFQLTGGRHVPAILGALSMGIILAIGLLAITGTQATGEEATDEPDAAGKPPRGTASATELVPASDDEERAVLERADAVLLKDRLFADPSLTLARIARRAGLPARDISGAINRRHAMNVSQYVNRFRIEEACRLMTTTDDTISNIHLDAGFQTKSNFNREFKRQMGLSPTEWRTQNADRPPPEGGRAVIGSQAGLVVRRA